MGIINRSDRIEEEYLWERTFAISRIVYPTTEINVGIALWSRGVEGGEGVVGRRVWFWVSIIEGVCVGSCCWLLLFLLVFGLLSVDSSFSLVSVEVAVGGFVSVVVVVVVVEDISLLELDPNILEEAEGCSGIRGENHWIKCFQWSFSTTSFLPTLHNIISHLQEIGYQRALIKCIICYIMIYSSFKHLRMM